MPSYIAGGFIGSLVAGVIGLLVHHQSYARESYNITECAKEYQFVEMGPARTLKFAIAPFVNPELIIKRATVLSIYPTRILA